VDELTLLTQISDKLTLLATAGDSLGSAVGFLSGLVVALIAAATWKG